MSIEITEDKEGRGPTEAELKNALAAVESVMTGKCAGFVVFGRVEADMGVSGDSFADGVPDEALADILIHLLQQAGLTPEFVIRRIAASWK